MIPLSYGDQESESGEELIKNWEKSKEMRRTIQERMKDRGSLPCGYMGCNDFGVGTKVDPESSDVKEKREKDIERQKEADDFNGLPYCRAVVGVTGTVPDFECYGGVSLKQIGSKRVKRERHT